MAKPRLVKVRALFYVLQQVMKRGCIGILIHPPFLIMRFRDYFTASFVTWLPTLTM